jgi:hypothetical protein
MPRTTVNLDPTVLRELKRRARAEGKSLGDVISQIVAPALRDDEARQRPRSFRWSTARMGPARVDLEDKEAVRRALGSG